jgi:cytochrome c553
MRELGMVVMGCVFFVVFFNAVIYPEIEYKGFSNSSSCTGKCYEEYVALNGTSVEIEQKKKALAATDPFSDIRSLWSGCVACHGANGEGGVGPMLAGQTADYISGRLISYKNGEQVGPMSALMWGQAAKLSQKEIDTIGEFIVAGLPSE